MSKREIPSIKKILPFQNTVDYLCQILDILSKCCYFYWKFSKFLVLLFICLLKLSSVFSQGMDDLLVDSSGKEHTKDIVIFFLTWINLACKTLMSFGRTVSIGMSNLNITALSNTKFSFVSWKKGGLTSFSKIRQW